MEISSFVPSTDNLYKFLFVIGTFMVVFSYIYPLEKQQELELELLLYNQQVEILNNEIADLKNDVENLKKISSLTLKKLEETKKNEKNNAEKVINELQEDFNKAFNEVKRKGVEINTKDIILDYEKSRIELLKKHISSFSFIKWFFFIFGSIFLVFGLYKWFIITRVAEKLNKQKLNNNN